MYNMYIGNIRVMVNGNILQLYCLSQHVLSSRGGLVGLNEYRVTCTPLSLRGIIWIRFKLTSFMMWISSELVPWRFKDFGDTHDSRKGLKSSDS